MLGLRAIFPGGVRQNAPVGASRTPRAGAEAPWRAARRGGGGGRGRRARVQARPGEVRRCGERPRGRPASTVAPGTPLRAAQVGGFRAPPPPGRSCRAAPAGPDPTPLCPARHLVRRRPGPRRTGAARARAARRRPCAQACAVRGSERGGEEAPSAGRGARPAGARRPAKCGVSHALFPRYSRAPRPARSYWAREKYPPVPFATHPLRDGLRDPPSVRPRPRPRRPHVASPLPCRRQGRGVRLLLPPRRARGVRRRRRRRVAGRRRARGSRRAARPRRAPRLLRVRRGRRGRVRSPPLAELGVRRRLRARGEAWARAPRGTASKLPSPVRPPPSSTQPPSYPPQPHPTPPPKAIVPIVIVVVVVLETLDDPKEADTAPY
jgi:hypothetical protein